MSQFTCPEECVLDVAFKERYTTYSSGGHLQNVLEVTAQVAASVNFRAHQCPPFWISKQFSSFATTHFEIER